MEENKLKPHDISVAMNKHLGTVNRWLKTGNINIMYEKDLNAWLTQKELENQLQ